MFDQSIPCGFRFLPTKEELISHFVKKKNEGYKLPIRILEISPYEKHPKTLPAYFKYGKRNENYYFAKLDAKSERDERVKRLVDGVGYWKNTSNDEEIIDSTTKKTIGFMKKFTFYEISPTKKMISTGWIMHEFRCEPSLMKGRSLTEFKKKNTGYVLCKVYLKTSSASSNSVESIDNGKGCVPMATDEEVEPGPIPPSTSCPPSTFPNVVLEETLISCPTANGVTDPDDPPLNQLCSTDDERDLESWIAELLDDGSTAVQSPTDFNCEVQQPELHNMASLSNGSLLYEDSRSKDMEEEFTSPIWSTY